MGIISEKKFRQIFIDKTELSQIDILSEQINMRSLERRMYRSGGSCPLIFLFLEVN